MNDMKRSDLALEISKLECLLKDQEQNCLFAQVILEPLWLVLNVSLVGFVNSVVSTTCLDGNIKS